VPIQRIKGGDERAFRELLESFHRTVVDPATKYIPGGAFYRGQAKRQKHTNDLLYEDLTAVGCFALWQSVFKFDAARGYRFNTLSRHKIIDAISNEANYLRQRGFTSGDNGRNLDLSALKFEAQQQGQWRNLVQSSLWQKQTQAILDDMYRMVNPPPPSPELQGLDDLREELADLKRQLDER
jgi:hypothetical protein